jgi:protein-disulfide isomerase
LSVRYRTPDVADDADPDADPSTVSRRRALVALTGVAAVGAGAVHGASTLGEDRELPASFTSSRGTSDHLGVEYTDRPVMGSLDAPLRLFYWTDYQCPYCKQFDENTLPKLAERRVRSGELAVVFLEYPLFGDDSWTAAALSKCVWRTVRGSDPDAWGRWHRHVFGQQGEKNDGWASPANLYDYSGTVEGVPVPGLRTCMRNDRESIVASVEADVATATEDLSLRRVTPMFALSDTESGRWTPIPGAQPYETFEKAIAKVKEA